MEKNKKFIVISVICLVGLLLISGIFIGIKNISFSNIKQENNVTNEIVNDNNNNDDDDESNNEEVTYDYKLVKMLDYSEIEDNKNSTNIVETKNYYVLEADIADDKNIVLYDKLGNDVTKQIFGVDNITYIDGLAYSENKDRYIVYTSDEKTGLYDSNFKQIIKIDNHTIERTYNDNYFMIGDKIENTDELADGELIGVLKNVGVYNKNGKVIIPRKYERLYLGGMYNGYSYYESNQILFYARKNGKYGIINENEKVVVPFEYDQEGLKYVLGLGEVFTVNKNNYFIMYKNGKYGMIDNNNKIIIKFDKNKLFYNKYANVVIEKIYDEDSVVKLNVYNLKGELKKEIKLTNTFKASFNAYYYKNSDNNFLLYDNDYVYVLNKNIEYEKYVKPSIVSYGKNTGLFLAGDKIYLKEKNGKYQVYNSSNNTLLLEDEFYFDDVIYSNSHMNGFVLCKNNDYTECGIVKFNGDIIDFKYDMNSYSYLKNNNKIIEINEYGEESQYIINGNCLLDEQDYVIHDNILKVGNAIYDLNCSKIAENINWFYKLNDNLLMVEGKEYRLYDMNTLELANIENVDNVVITNYIGFNMLDDVAVIMTNKGIYKIVKN